MRGYYLTILFTLILFPSYASASVSINEVAWMGGVDSANHEWIELYNEGTEDVSVEGWVLDDGLKLSINLTGVISANTYAVLERTSEDSAPGAAFLIYTGALVNGGTTLVLRDASGGIRDQVNGGENWVNIGGDNVTKETAQYTTSGWVTDTPTPGNKNASGRVVTSSDTDTNTTSNTTTSGSGNNNSTASVNLRNTETKLTLIANIQSVAYVNQKIPASVVASGLTDKLQRLVDYEWNFGDGSTETTRKVEHTYLYPGSYVITVYGKKDKVEQIVRREITVLPVDFSMTLNERGDVQVHNDALYDVDMSGYLLKGLNDFVFPERSIILPRATITIPAHYLGGRMTNYLVALYDTRRVLVTSTYPKYLASTETLSNTTFVDTIKNVVTNPVIKPTEFRIGVSNVEASDDIVVEEGGIMLIPAESEVLGENGNGNTRWPYVVFILMLLGAVFAIFSSNSKGESVIVTK